VAAYRLIGYENRMLKHEDFNDDKKDAGEIGSGHSVTALYEIVPAGVEIDLPTVDPLKYQTPAPPARSASGDELVTVKLRYKAPDGETSRLLSATIRSQPGQMTANLGFASAVAEAGMLLRGSKHAGSADLKAAAARAAKFRGADPEGYRAEFVKLAQLASSLRGFEAAAR
jgi:Ca-activated chloride channel homolog